MPDVIEQVRIGSHQVFHPRVNYQTGEEDTKHGWNETVIDFETVYHDCLVSKEWLKAHYKDEYPEPTIELSVDGKTLSLNGNYKKGLIKEFIKANKET